MRIIEAELITDTIRQMCIDSCCDMPENVYNALKNAKEKERSPFGKEILSQLITNIEIAREKRMPACQDTGMAVVFVDIGQDVHINGDLFKAIEQGVSQGYKQGYLRASTVTPIDRKNPGDNTPPIVHYDIVPGDKLTLNIAPKGFGSENMSALKMLTPSSGLEGVKEFIIETVKKAGANPCPPIVVSVGIGGTMEKAALMAKRQLLREIGSVNPDKFLADLETELLNKINDLGIGPGGLGGDTTALAVFIDTYETHIAGLPVAVNMQCHAARHKTVIL